MFTCTQVIKNAVPEGRAFDQGVHIISGLFNLLNLCPKVEMAVELPPPSSTYWTHMICIVTASSGRHSWSVAMTMPKFLAILTVRHTLEFSKGLKTTFFAIRVYGALTILTMHHVATVNITTVIDNIFVFSCFHSFNLSIVCFFCGLTQAYLLGIKCQIKKPPQQSAIREVFEKGGFVIYQEASSFSNFFIHFLPR